MTNKNTDEEWYDSTIEKVETTTYGWEVTTEYGTCMVKSKNTPIPPVVGMTLTFFGRPYSFFRGMELDGYTIFYRTEEEQERKNKADLAESERKTKQEFEENKANLDARFDALPPLFQERIARFRSNAPDFRWRIEPYELFICEEAVKIAAAIDTIEALRDFNTLSWNEQKALAPSIDDGHSGNTWGMSVRLAYHLKTVPENVVREHAGMAPLLSCDGAGCPPVIDETPPRPEPDQPEGA